MPTRTDFAGLIGDIGVGERAEYRFTYATPGANSYSFEIFWND